ncbi:LysR family transcriptional regulator [Variovorax sp. UC122_21]|uniref:helix-turn-helix domain-containing protein n=1 Tax=Variovorax sp. UC122_21 TaxID=3374554 RepID=UPI003756D768
MADRKRTEVDWQDVRVFLALGRYRSLSAAARALQVNHATIARRLQSLEDSMGEKARGAQARRIRSDARGRRGPARGHGHGSRCAAAHADRSQRGRGPARGGAHRTHRRHSAMPSSRHNWPG